MSDREELRKTKYENRARRPAEVSYDLAYYGDNLETAAQIVECLRRLPERVQGFALDRCRFVSVGKHISGITLPGRVGARDGRTRNVWIIILEEKADPEEALGTIAHEIAHAWLGHDRLGLDSSVEIEVQAATLARDWGFKGTGADPDFQQQQW